MGPHKTNVSEECGHISWIFEQTRPESAILVSEAYVVVWFRAASEPCIDGGGTDMLLLGIVEQKLI
jgi:hypothetical protein